MSKDITIQQFLKRFPDDEACLHELYLLRYMAGTIPHKSTSALCDRFFVMYVVSTTRNGISAKHLQKYADEFAFRYS